MCRSILLKVVLNFGVHIAASFYQYSPCRCCDNFCNGILGVTLCLACVMLVNALQSPCTQYLGNNMTVNIYW